MSKHKAQQFLLALGFFSNPSATRSLGISPSEGSLRHPHCFYHRNILPFNRTWPGKDSGHQVKLFTRSSQSTSPSPEPQPGPTSVMAAQGGELTFTSHPQLLSALDTCSSCTSHCRTKGSNTASLSLLQCHQGTKQQPTISDPLQSNQRLREVVGQGTVTPHPDLHQSRPCTSATAAAALASVLALSRWARHLDASLQPQPGDQGWSWVSRAAQDGSELQSEVPVSVGWCSGSQPSSKRFTACGQGSDGPSHVREQTDGNN